MWNPGREKQWRKVKRTGESKGKHFSVCENGARNALFRMNFLINNNTLKE